MLNCGTFGSISATCWPRATPIWRSPPANRCAYWCSAAYGTDTSPTTSAARCGTRFALSRRITARFRLMFDPRGGGRAYHGNSRASPASDPLRRPEMASIQVNGGNGRTKAVDSEIPLVPFIDLLLCCIMFLLVTAVWNQLAQLTTRQIGPTPPDQITAPPTPPHELSVEVRTAGYILSSPAGDRVEIPLAADHHDLVALRE